MTTTPPLTPEERLARLEGVYDHLATQAHIGEVKAEIGEAKAEMQARIGEVKAEIGEVKAEMQARIGEVKAEIARSEGDLKAEIANLKGSFRTLLIAVSAGLALLNIILRFWPS